MRLVYKFWPQETGLAVNSRIWRSQEWQPKHWNTRDFERGIFKINCLLGFVVNDPCRLYLPQRRALGVIFTRLAGCIGGLVELNNIAVNPFGMRSGKTGFVFAQNLEGLNKSVFKIVGQVEFITITHRTVGLGYFGIANRQNTFGFAVISDAVCLQHAALIIDLNIANGGNCIIVLVVDHLVGLNEHLLRVWRGGCSAGCLYKT